MHSRCVVVIPLTVVLVELLLWNYGGRDGGANALVIYRRKPKPKLVCHEEFTADEEEIGAPTIFGPQFSAANNEDDEIIESEASDENITTTTKLTTKPTTKPPTTTKPRTTTKSTTKRTANNKNENENDNKSENESDNENESRVRRAATVSGEMETVGDGATVMLRSKTTPPTTIRGQTTTKTTKTMEADNNDNRKTRPKSSEKRKSDADFEPIIKLGSIDESAEAGGGGSVAPAADFDEADAGFEIVGENLTADEKAAIRRKLAKTCHALNLH